MTESLLLAALGGVLGLGLAIVAVKVLGRFGPANIPRLGEVGVDGRVLVFTFGISLVTGVVFGLMPALRASRFDLNDVLREGGFDTFKMNGTEELGILDSARKVDQAVGQL